MPRIITVIALVVLAVACGANPSQREREQAMDRWEVLVRWGEFEALVDFMHPEWLAENPISEDDLERLQQFRVTRYRVRQVLAEPDGQAVERVARLHLYETTTARERVIDHREIWRYDDDIGRWLLHSGLPDPDTT